jgi:hypothetical protein
VATDGWAAFVQGVEHADGVRLGHAGGDEVAGPPFDSRCLAGGGRLPAGGVGAEDEGNRLEFGPPKSSLKGRGRSSPRPGLL